MGDKNDSPELELNKESSSELGPDEVGQIAGGLRRPVLGGGEATSASCCVGCNTLDTVTSGCKG